MNDHPTIRSVVPSNLFTSGRVQVVMEPPQQRALPRMPPEEVLCAFSVRLRGIPERFYVTMMTLQSSCRPV